METVIYKGTKYYINKHGVVFYYNGRDILSNDTHEYLKVEFADCKTSDIIKDKLNE